MIRLWKWLFLCLQKPVNAEERSVKLELITPPSPLPITVAECKSDLRISSSAEDALIQHYIDAAFDYVSGPDGVSGRVFGAQTWRLSVPAPENGRINIPISPAVSIVSLSFYDSDNVLTVADLDDFVFFTDFDSAYVQPKIGKSWPAVYIRDDAFLVSFIAGKDATLAIKRAMRLIVSSWYENRSDNQDRELMTIPHGAMALISNSRAGWVG
jgi:uncharacterized phiE125 gp8 family phage protein